MAWYLQQTCAKDIDTGKKIQKAMLINANNMRIGCLSETPQPDNMQAACCLMDAKVLSDVCKLTYAGLYLRRDTDVIQTNHELLHVSVASGFPSTRHMMYATHARSLLLYGKAHIFECDTSSHTPAALCLMLATSPHGDTMSGVGRQLLLDGEQAKSVIIVFEQRLWRSLGLARFATGLSSQFQAA